MKNRGRFLSYAMTSSSKAVVAGLPEDNTDTELELATKDGRTNV
jgi:hypothetical protein